MWFNHPVVQALIIVSLMIPASRQVSGEEHSGQPYLSCEQRAANIVRPGLEVGVPKDFSLRMMEILVWTCHCEGSQSSEACRRGIPEWQPSLRAL